jgi:hypothetical protein
MMALPADQPGEIQADIPYGLIEYTAVFEQLIIETWQPQTLIPTVLKALGRWGFTLDGAEVRTRTDKLSEYAVVFRRTNPPSPNLAITLSLNKLVILAENVDWADAESFIETVNVALRAIMEATRVRIRSQHLTLAMHVQLKTGTKRDVTARLVTPAALGLLEGDVKFSGIILQREKVNVIIDASLAYPNGLFIRIMREHPSEATLQQLATVLHRDEEQVLQALGIRGVM